MRRECNSDKHHVKISLLGEDLKLARIRNVKIY